tara:strand:+ start:2941 stop:3432 length:492 start_codon:yes stop_codon:yes gene_type:complete
LFSLSTTIEANGSVKNYQENQVGNFVIGIGSIPDQPVKGLNHFALYVRKQESQEKFQNLKVYLSPSIENMDSAQIFKSEMNNTLFDPEYYEVDISLDSEGKWFLLIDVEVNENQLDSHNFSTVFEIDVVSPNPLNSFLTLGLLAFLGVIILRYIFNIIFRKNK